MVDENKLDKKRYEELLQKEKELSGLKEQAGKVEIVDDSLEKEFRSEAEKILTETFACPNCNNPIEPNSPKCNSCGKNLKWTD